MRPGLLLAGLAAAALGLTGCTTIPSSSSPEIIQSLQVGQTPAGARVTPAPNADQREIVQDFLALNVTQDQHHSAARNFLTAEARNRWNDATTTVVNSSTWEIGNFSPANSTVTARGQVLGTVSAAGIYTPVLQGDGNGGPTATFTFVLKQNPARQWRIDALPPGLLVLSQDFQQTFEAHNLYFYDLAGAHLIPDPRYTALVDPDQLSNWLIQQLVAGPRPELQSVTASEAAQIDPQRVVVTVGASITSIEIPGAGQLDAATRNYLAAQIAATLESVALPHTLVITDGGRPVAIPSASATSFTLADFGTTIGTTSVPPPLFYLRNGAVVDEHGIALSGTLSTGHYHLTSVALARNGQTDLYVAGTRGPPNNEQLLVGTRNQGLDVTSVHGRLSRPSWAPDVDEVWVGDGGTVWRITAAGQASRVSLSPTSGVISGDIIAVRLSPDGSRVALVVQSHGGAGHLWVGSIARSPSGAVSVSNLSQISPQGLDLFDVAWYGAVKLFAIGQPVAGGVASSFEVQVDGSLWTQHGTIGLPQTPDTVTVAENAFAWVSAGTTVWRQTGGEWTSPIGSNTVGTDPVYLE